MRFSYLYTVLRCDLISNMPSNLKKDINHLERIQMTATRWVNGLTGLTYEERLQVLKLQPLEKRRLRNDLVLTHKMLYKHIDLEATHLFKISRRPGIRRSSIRLLHQTGRTCRRRNNFACKVVNNGSRLPLTVGSVTGQREFKKTIRLTPLLIFFPFILFSPQYGLFGHFVPSRPVNTYTHFSSLVTAF